MDTWTSVLVSWTPFVALIVIWLILARWGRTKSPVAQLVTEMERMNGLLEWITLVLEKRVEK
jgi:hypothetical protein